MSNPFTTLIERHPDQFEMRHIGPDQTQTQAMLEYLGVKSCDELIGSTVPEEIRLKKPLRLEKAKSEYEAISLFKKLLSQNQIFKSYIGTGYVDTITPPVILRNVLENPGWYTQYTPYQAEIAQGRLEALLNFQTMIVDFTGHEISNASLLDEGTAAAEAMAMSYAVQGKNPDKKFFVAKDCHPQTIAVIETRAKYLGIHLLIEDAQKFDFKTPIFGALLQYPTTFGIVNDYSAWIKKAHEHQALVTLAVDLMSLAVLKSPAELGADMAVGNTQCFGVPMGFGGPHAAFISTKDAYKRQMPGRIVGLSKDAFGKPAVRLALQTREQHIRRDKATSNICTAQVLLAIMASMYAVYHGPRGIKKIAERIHLMTVAVSHALKKLGYTVDDGFFSTLWVGLNEVSSLEIHKFAEAKRLNLRKIDTKSVGITIDESVTVSDLEELVQVFAQAKKTTISLKDFFADVKSELPEALKRESKYLTHPVFNSHHSETKMLRYITTLQGRDLSLAQSMIALGSCTMKLNATSEMLPVTWPEVSKIHPFVPENQREGYLGMIQGLENMLAEITGFAGISLQPNAGSQGEFAGLLVIRKFQEEKGEAHRDVCLIPQSAHGTNPASAAMAGMKVVIVNCDSEGNVDVKDLKEKAVLHAKNLSALMITYPSTHGVFEESIREICEIIHTNGGQVYMDGANMNAQVGLCRPGDFGPDVCHLNLHKTFCIPHGGGGPGVGPIGVAPHLVPHLPGHPVVKCGGEKGIGAISAAPWGSASILPISYLYIQMMGEEGLKRATEVAILNANYVAKKLSPHYPVLYRGKKGFVAHECIIDLRPIKDQTGIEVEDVAKRLMDYGFHAPTVSFPVPGTMMIEPTESEAKDELDRFCEAMILIREEIQEVASGQADRKNNVLKNAPHTSEMVAKTEWPYAYSREKAAFPVSWVRNAKFWPFVARIDNVYGERNLVCACPPVEAYQ